MGGSQRVPPSSRRWSLAIWWLALAALAVLALLPVATTATRLAQLGDGLAFLSATAWRWWPSRLVRGLLACVVLAMLATLLLPPRTPDVPGLRQRYCRRLLAYAGTRYVWGGEGILGVDCSGLVRRAFIEANLLEGLARADAGALRRGLWLWWNDQSAACLRDGGLGTTRLVGTAASLRAVAQGLVRPGDLAVTRDGVHVLAALGAGRWMQASPGQGRVLAMGPGDDDPWWAAPVCLVRWTALDEEAGPGER